MQREDLNKKLEIIIEAMDLKNAIDIETIDISEKSSIADYFVIASANSSLQAVAISDAVEEKMEENGYELKNIEGKNSNRWILLDFSDIIVHVFHKDEREYYNLERLWKND